MFYAYGQAATTGVAVDTNWHHLKIYWVSANKIGMTLDGGAAATVCSSGCTITDTFSYANWAYAAGASCGSGSTAAAATMDLDYFGFLASVGIR